MRIFVTGGTGLVGSHLLALCVKKKYKVVALRRKGSVENQLKYVFKFYCLDYNECSKEYIQWITGELYDVKLLTEYMHGCDVVIHCAAIVGLGGVDKDRMKMVNVEYTRNIISASKKAGIRKICYLSSIAALGRSENGKYIDEDSKWYDSDIHSVYSITKHDAMTVVLNAQDKALKCVAVCPGPILGVSCYDNGSSQIIYLAKKGVPFATNGGSGYVDVRDVCEVMLILSEIEPKFQKYVLVGENLSNSDLLDKLCIGFGKNRPIILNKKIIFCAAYLAEALWGICGKKPQLDRNMARTITNRSYYSSDKIMQEIGFKFTPMSKTIDDICRYMK